MKADYSLKDLCVRDCVTYSVCEHFHPYKLLLWSLCVIMVKTQIYKPVSHTHTQTKIPVNYEHVQQTNTLHSTGSVQEFILVSFIAGTCQKHLKKCRIQNEVATEKTYFYIYTELVVVALRDCAERISRQL